MHCFSFKGQVPTSYTLKFSSLSCGCAQGQTKYGRASDTTLVPDTWFSCFSLVLLSKTLGKGNTIHWPAWVAQNQGFFIVGFFFFSAQRPVQEPTLTSVAPAQKITKPAAKYGVPLTIRKSCGAPKKPNEKKPLTKIRQVRS